MRTNETQDWRRLRPGPELNSLVSERVMGERVRWTELPGGGRVLPEVGHGRILPAYASDITYAWRVVERLQAMGVNGWHVRVETTDDGKEWACYVWDDPDANAIGAGIAHDAPLAICRAALAAIEAQDGAA